MTSQNHIYIVWLLNFFNFTVIYLILQWKLYFDWSGSHFSVNA